jgi:RNA polymerase sigma factor (sigma-70 family)
MSDSDLLQAFVRTRNPRVFADLVRRHLELVYGAAHRLTPGGADAAQDVTEQVFLDVRAKAARLLHHPCLPLWLYENTRFVALNTVQPAAKAAGREGEAIRPATVETSSSWERIRPVFDDALEQLDVRDRELLVLRFLAQQPLAEVAGRLDLTETAAQKAINRALELLSGALARRGITLSGPAIAAALEKAPRPTPQAVSHAVITAVTAPESAAEAERKSGGQTLALVAGVAVLLGISVLAGYGIGQRHAAATHVTDVSGQEREWKHRIETLEQQLDAANRRASTAEADTSAMLNALQQAKPKPTASGAPEWDFTALVSAESAVPVVVVIGQVTAPARVHFVEGMTLQMLIDKVGGFRELARRNAVKVTRTNGDGTSSVFTIDATTAATTFVLQAHDVVYVPEKIL